MKTIARGDYTMWFYPRPDKRHRPWRRRLRRFKTWRVSVPGFLHTLNFDTALKAEPHLRRCAEILDRYAPAYYAELHHGLVNEVKALRNWHETITELDEETMNVRDGMALARGRAKSVGGRLFRALIQLPLKLITKVPGKLAHNFRINMYSIFLSFMLFLGLCEIFDVDLRDPFPDLLFRGAFPFCLALGVNLATQESLKEGVLKLLIDRTKGDGNENQECRPFWQELWRGNSTLWHGFAFVCFEGGLASALLFARLPIQIRSNVLMVVGVMIASTYFAYQNVALAWSQGLRAYRLRQEEGNLAIPGMADVMTGNGDHMDEAWQQRREAQVEASRKKVRLRTVENRLKHSKREYKRAYRNAVRLTRQWFRMLPYLMEALEENGASLNEIHEVAAFLENGNGKAWTNEARVQ